MNTDKLVPAWYALHTRSRFENVVSDGLLKKSLEVFLPKILVRSRRRDRKMMIRMPLFPGYLFVKTDLEPARQLDVLKTVGVVRFIGSKDGPISIPADNIESLKIMISNDGPVETGTRFKKGDRVMVISGPLMGVIGTFSRYRGQGRIIVHIEALGQFAGVEVREDDVEKLPKILS